VKELAKILGILVIVVLLIGSLLTGIGLSADDWTAPERSEQMNEEMESARQICAGWALLAVPVSILWGLIQYRRGRAAG
jgi:hypothetical protein